MIRPLIVALILTSTLVEVATSQTEPPVPPFVGVINADDVYVRAWASKNYYEIAKLNKGALVEVTEELYGWYIIKAPAGTFSYISQQYVTLDADGKTGTVSGSEVHVRAPSSLGPSRSYKSQLKLDRGAKVTILGSEDGWYKIVPPEGAQAAVFGQYVDKATPAQIAAATGRPVVEPQAAPHSQPVVEPQPAPQPQPVVQPQPAPQPLIGVEPVTEPVREPLIAVEPVTEPAREPLIAVEPVVEPAPQPATNGEPVVAPEPVVEPAPAPTVGGPDAATRLALLEAQFARESTKPLADQPIEQLTNEYLALQADQTLTEAERILVETRLEMLRTRNELARMQRELDEARNRLAQTTAPDGTPVKKYDAVGTLLASTLYTGERLPLLYRLVDPLTGRTIGYVEPGKDGKISNMLGRLVGIVGMARYQAGLKLNIIDVRSIDLLQAAGN